MFHLLCLHLCFGDGVEVSGLEAFEAGEESFDSVGIFEFSACELEVDHRAIEFDGLCASELGEVTIDGDDVELRDVGGLDDGGRVGVVAEPDVGGPDDTMAGLLKRIDQRRMFGSVQ